MRAQGTVILKWPEQNWQRGKPVVEERQLRHEKSASVVASRRKRRRFVAATVANACFYKKLHFLEEILKIKMSQTRPCPILL